MISASCSYFRTTRYTWTFQVLL